MSLFYTNPLNRQILEATDNKNENITAVYPDNYTWEDIANELNTGTLVPGILIALTLPGRLKYSSADETYRAVVEKTISKAILPIEAENESKLFSLWFSVPFSPT